MEVSTWTGEQLAVGSQHADSVRVIVFSQANGDAALGQYAAGSIQGAAGDTGLFIKDHAY